MNNTQTAQEKQDELDRVEDALYQIKMESFREHTRQTIAQIAYDSYCNTRDWKAYNGDPLPQYASLPDGIKAGWIKAAVAVHNFCLAPCNHL